MKAAPSIWMSQRWRLVAPLLPFVVVAVFLELLPSLGIQARDVLPAPSAVAQTLWTQRAVLGTALWQTFVGAAGGFILSCVCGISLGILLGLSSLARAMLYPYAVFFQTVPVIAIAPMLVIWLGLGIQVVVASAFLVSVFPIIASTLAGILSVEPAQRDIFSLYRASTFDRVCKLLIPASLPSLLTGMRVAAGLAVVGAIVGEFISGGGLGAVIDASRQRQRLDLTFAAILLSALLGLGFFALINALSRVLLRHRTAGGQEIG